MPSTSTFTLGQTFYNGLTIDTSNYNGIPLEGLVCEWETDRDLTTPTKRRTALKRVSIIVRNVSGIALLPGRVCSWQADQLGKRVAGYTTTTAALPAGIVDDALPAAGVPNGDLFHLIVQGPCLVRQALSNLGADVAQGDVIYAITAATSQSTTAGRFDRWAGTFSAAETTDGTAGNIILNRIGRAISTSLTSSTDANKLVYVDLPWGL